MSIGTIERKNKMIIPIKDGDECLNLNVLPTKIDILKCRLKMQQNGLKYQEANKEIIEQIKHIYRIAGIPYVSDRSIERSIDKYYEEFVNLEKYPLQRYESFTTTIMSFLEDGNKLMNFASDISKCLPEDIQFFNNMLSSRDMRMSENDIAKREAILATERQREFLKENQKKIEKERRELEMQQNTIGIEEHLTLRQSHSDESDSDDKNDVVDEFHPRRIHRQGMYPGCNIYIPGNILQNENLVSLMARIDMSHSQACSFIQTLIKECGGNPRNVHLTVNYSFRHRQETMHNASLYIKERFKPNFPLGLHWDGKSMDDIGEGSHGSTERLAVIVSDFEGNTKFLGAPKVPIGVEPGMAGINYANAVIHLVNEWKLQDCIASMNFDTTNSNTGKSTGACIRIQEVMDRPLLWCGCRKHVGELHLTHAWESLKVEVTQGPKISIFNIFKDQFHLIDLEKAPMKIFDINSIQSKDKSFFYNQISIIIQIFNEVQESGAYLRGDNKELIDLVLMFLGRKTDYKIHKPGATHKARWVMKLLHSIKIVMLEDCLPKDIFGKGSSGISKVKKLKRFVFFFVFCYIPWWYTCPLSTSAARNDIIFHEKVLRYTDIDKDISNAVLKSIQRHQWYVVPEMVPLALFDKTLNIHVKKSLAMKILSFPKLEKFQSREGNHWGKPVFPSNMPTDVVQAASSPDVWKFFEILQISHDFLKTSPDTWDENPTYIDGLKKVGHMKVTNDSAERGVKLIQGSISQTKSEDKLQDICQVIEESRALNPNLRKMFEK